MARASMTALIARERILINDVASPQTFTDDDIERVMDATRQDVRYLRLRPEPTYGSGTIQYLDYFAPNLGDWEDDTTFWQNLRTQVTPSTNEPIVGHWKFAASITPSVYLIGKTYDVYRSAADLLERKATSLSQQYDVVVGGQTFDRSQQTDMLEGRIKSYRAKQRPRTSSLVRSDLNTSRESDVMGPRWPRDWGWY